MSTYVVGLEVFDILVNSFRQLGQTGWRLEAGRLDERSPRPDLFSSLRQPFSEIDENSIIFNHSPSSFLIISKQYSIIFN
jgi:hypothetical protein